MAWQLEQAFICQSCGTGSWEWDDDIHAYRAEPYFCPGCSKVETTRETPDVKGRKGMHVGLVRRRPYGDGYFPGPVQGDPHSPESARRQR